MRHAPRSAILAVALLTAFAGRAGAVSPILKEMEDGFVRLHEEVRPFVVNIDTKSSGDEEDMGMDYPNIFRFFGVPNPEGSPRNMPNMPPHAMPRGGHPRRAQGSGFIYDKEGHVVTNNHVVEDAETITVKLADGKEYDAKVVGRDGDTDLAVLKIEGAGDLPVAPLGDSDKLKVGQFAIAVGSPRGFEGSFSFGHVSALGRNEVMPHDLLRFQNFIQTDAAINLGNSGGPLCNLDGEVIGINIAIVGGANSLGFAIPSNTARDIVPQLISGGKVTRGFLGVGITDVRLYAEAVGLGDNQGAFVKEVRPGTPAERAGLKLYDVIRKVNGEAIVESSDLVRRISALAPGASAKLEIWRDKQTIEVEVKLDEYAGSVREAMRGKDVFGLHVENLSQEWIERLRLKPGTAGVVVSGIEGGSAAEDARLLEGDIITEVAQQKVANTEDFNRLVRENAVPGKSLLIGFLRGGTEHDITVIKIPKEGEEKKE